MLDYENDIEPNKLFNQVHFLKTAIGQKLTDIERFFAMDPEVFWEYHVELREQTDKYFSLNPGTTQFWFNYNSNHTFRYYSANAPIIRFPGVYPKDIYSVYRLSIVSELASLKLKDCLGELCEDVRIWNFSETSHKVRIRTSKYDLDDELEKDNIEIPDEITPSGISYLLSNGQEIIYSCNFYDDTLSDNLLFVKDIHQDYVDSCFSLKEDKYILK
jgi:hypothetical protein